MAAEITRVLDGLPGTIQMALTSGQPLWYTQATQLCEAEALIFEGGTLQPAIAETCLVKEIEKRVCRFIEFRAKYETTKGTDAAVWTCPE